MPAYQWVVLKKYTQNDDVKKTSPVTITNREFANQPSQKAIDVQLFKNEGATKMYVKNQAFDDNAIATTDSLTFTAVPASSKSDANLGYKKLTKEELMVNKYTFNYWHPYATDKFIAQSANDSTLTVMNGKDAFVIDTIPAINKVKNTSFVKQFEYFITDDNFNEQKFVTKDIIRLYYQIMYLKMKRVFIFLNYDEKKFTNKKWCLLIDFFNCVLNSTSRNINKYINRDNIESLIDFIKEKKFFTITKLKIYFTKNEVRELFNFVRVNNYDLFSEFYDCKKVELKGGSFKSEW